MWEYELKVFDEQYNEIDFYDTVKGIRIKESLEEEFDTLDLHYFVSDYYFIRKDFLLYISEKLPKNKQLEIIYGSKSEDRGGRIVLLNGEIIVADECSYAKLMGNMCEMCHSHKAIDYDDEENKFVCKNCLEVILYDRYV